MIRHIVHHAQPNHEQRRHQRPQDDVSLLPLHLGTNTNIDAMKNAFTDSITPIAIRYIILVSLKSILRFLIFLSPFQALRNDNNYQNFKWCQNKRRPDPPPNPSYFHLISHHLVNSRRIPRIQIFDHIHRPLAPGGFDLLFTIGFERIT